MCDDNIKDEEKNKLKVTIFLHCLESGKNIN